MSDGKGCRCAANSEFECGCEGVDWTPHEVYYLRAKCADLERDKVRLEDKLKSYTVIYIEELEATVERLTNLLKKNLSDLATTCGTDWPKRPACGKCDRCNSWAALSGQGEVDAKD